MVDVSEVHIMLVLRERQVNMVKDRVNDMGFKVLNEGTKTMRVQGVEYISGESIQCETKGSVISTCKLEVLGAGNSMKQVNEFMDDCIIFIEGVIF